MKKIIQKINDLYGSLEVRLKKIEEDNARLQSQKGKVNKETEILEEAKRLLAIRENKIKGLENIVEEKTRLAEALKRLSSDKKILNKGQMALENDKKEHEKKVNADNAAIAASKDKIKRLSEEASKLKEKYKSEALKDISKILAKKGIKL